MDESSQNCNLRSLAHVAKRPAGCWDEHALEEHLRAIAVGACMNADRFGAARWGHLAGLWHDLGKYAPDFQHYIRDASGYEREQAHIEEGRGSDGKLRQRVDHSAAGAIHAVDRLGTAGIVIANLIAAHHAGLYDATDLERRLQSRDRLDAALTAAIPSNVLDTGNAPALAVPGGASTPGAYALWLRMLLSCLVDADFLDTECFMDEGGEGRTSRKLPRDRHIESRSRPTSRCDDRKRCAYAGQPITRSGAGRLPPRRCRTQRSFLAHCSNWRWQDAL